MFHSAGGPAKARRFFCFLLRIGEDRLEVFVTAEPADCIRAGEDRLASAGLDLLGRRNGELFGNALTAQGRIDFGMYNFNEVLPDTWKIDDSKSLTSFVFRPDLIFGFFSVQIHRILAGGCSFYK